HRLQQLAYTHPGWVLVVAFLDGRHCHLSQQFRAGPFGKALAEVDRPRGDRQRGHLGKDRGAERGQTRGNPPNRGANGAVTAAWFVRARVASHPNEHRALRSWGYPGQDVVAVSPGGHAAASRL